MLAGVVVLRVGGGPAARLGLRPGDVVAEVAGRAIDTTAGLARALSRDRREWPIAVRRDGETLRVTVRAG